MSLHLELAEIVDQELAEYLDGAVERKQDALVMRIANGVVLTVRYAAPDAYSLRWSHAGEEACIDTAPVHRELATFPNHFHARSGRLLADPVTDPARRPEDNVRRLVLALLADPGLGAEAATR